MRLNHSVELSFRSANVRQAVNVFRQVVHNCEIVSGEAGSRCTKNRAANGGRVSNNELGQWCHLIVSA